MKNNKYKNSELSFKIKVADPKYLPLYVDDGVKSNYAILYASVPPDCNNNKRLTIAHRGTATVDCGIDVGPMEDYRAVINLSESWQGRGLSSITRYVSNGRVKLMVCNVGKEIIVINDKDAVATMHIEPVYKFKLEEN